MAASKQTKPSKKWTAQKWELEPNFQNRKKPERRPHCKYSKKFHI